MQGIGDKRFIESFKHFWNLNTTKYSLKSVRQSLFIMNILLFLPWVSQDKINWKINLLNITKQISS